MTDRRIGPGRPEPLGLTLEAGGANVAVVSAHATTVELCLFDGGGERESERIALPERTGDVFHGFVGGLAEGQRYGLRVHGPWDPRAGHRFNPAKLLIEPYALALDRPCRLHPSMFGFVRGTDRADGADSAPFMPKAILTRPEPAPRWAGAPAFADTILSEVHVRGFTKRHPGVPEAQRGTFAGLASPAALAHFDALGITTVELMPAAAWTDERHLAPLGLSNYWGYNPVAMLAPDPRLAPGGWAEIRAAVAALHETGLEVILDVVFNHSGESDELGPTIAFRGLDNALYYRLDPADSARYVNDAGCGNILAADRTPVVRLVLDALRAWALYGGIDGFRFDLATTLGRRTDGFDPNAPILAAIEQDPLLRSLKLIAEPWDIGPGGYQLGAFRAPWGEWNDKYRDDVRRFWRGDGSNGALATRLCGSSDVFWAKRRPSRSINFVAAHDGFTLADTVAYTHKRNAANGEDNRDGTDANWSWSNGVEGPSEDPAVREARARDQRNLLATLLLSRGTPMLGPGSEIGQSQGGNNNAYAQDNETAWLDWSAPDHPLIGFIRRCIDLRRAHPALRADRFLTGSAEADATYPDVVWRRPDGSAPQGADWSAAGTLIAVLASPSGAEEIPDDRLVLIIHAGPTAVAVRLPEPTPGRRWRVALDTSAPDGRPDAAAEAGASLDVPARSVLVLAEGGGASGTRIARPAAAATLDTLSRAAGIAPEWFDIGGTRHPVSPDTKRSLLAAMGYPAGTAGEARDSLARLGEAALRPLPARFVARAREPIALPVTGAGPRALVIEGEDGSTRLVPLTPGDGAATSTRAPDGRQAPRVTVTLPPLAAGRYRVRDADRPEIAAALTVAPPRCYMPPALADGGRLFGVAAHLYSLRHDGDSGIGDFTTLQRFGIAAARHGARFVGLNPIHAQFDYHRERASPYHPSDRRFLDPIYLDVGDATVLADTPEVGSAHVSTARTAAALRAGRLVDYPAVWALKRQVLEASFASFEARRAARPSSPEAQAFAAFVAAGGDALRRFCIFQALTEAHEGAEWFAWDAGLRDPADPAVASFAAAQEPRLRYHAYLQWLCDRQFGAAVAGAAAAGLSLGAYRDLAVGTAPDGAEAWSERAAYVLGVSIGSPPDPFSAEGQIWCLPPPNPLVPDSARVFAELLAANMRHAGALRIDHAMGLQRLFWVPDGAKGSEGAYVAYDLEANLAELALESQRARCVVIGEDLGTVAEGFRERLAAADVLSYRVMIFERDGEGFLPPAAYPAKAVACVSTHDLPTLAGWWEGTDIAERRALGSLDEAKAAEDLARRRREAAALASAVGVPNAARAALVPLSVVEGVHRFIAATPCSLAVAQIDDIVGERVAVNLPGTDQERPNWRRRLDGEAESLFDGPAGKLPPRP